MGVVPVAWAGGGVVWDPAGGVGDLADPTDWGGGVLPGPGDSVVFDTPGGSTTANLSLPALVVSGISIVSGDTTFDLGGGTYAGGLTGVGTGGGSAGVLVLDGTLSATSFELGDGAGSDVDWVVGADGAVTTTGAFTAMSDAVVLMDGGTLTAASLSLAAAIDFQAGAIVVNGGLTWAGLGSPGPITLDASRMLAVGQAFTSGAAGTLTLDGGVFSVGSFTAGSSLDYQSGGLTVTAGSLGVGGSQVIAASTTLNAGDQWDIGDTLSTASGFSLTLDGGVVVADALTNAGTYTQISGTTTVSTLTNSASGTFNLNGGTLTAGQVAGNAGTFNIAGGSTFRLTGEDLVLAAGEDFGDTFGIGVGGTLRVDMETHVGASGAGTLSLGADAALFTAALVVGDDTTINRDATADIRANQISNAGTVGLDAIAGWDVRPWTTSSIGLINNGTLTHNTSAVSTVAARVVGSGAVDVQAGTVVLDNRAAAFDWSTGNDFFIAHGAELAFQSTYGPAGNFSDMTLLGSAMIENNGTLRLVDQHLILRGGYTGTGALVMEQDARVSVDSFNGPISISDLAASGAPTFRRIAGGVVDLTIHNSGGMNVDFGPGIGVTFVEDVTLTGGSFNETITNVGVLRLADGAEISRPPNGLGDEGLTHNMAGASMLLGDGASALLYGLMQNDGLVSMGAGSALLEVRDLEGTGVLSSGDGTLELFISNLDNWDGTFAGNGDSSLNVTYRGGGTLTGPGSIDTDGDISLRLVNTLALDGALRVGGTFTINRTSNFELDLSDTAVDLHDVRTIDAGTWRIHSAPTLALDRLTIHDNHAGDPGHLVIDYDGELTIGAGGIAAGSGLTVLGGGTFRIDGPSVPRYYTVLDDGTLEVGAGLAAGAVNEVGLHDNAHLINNAGSTIDSLVLDIESNDTRFTNHGTVNTTLVDETVDWSGVSALTNHGTIVFAVDETFILSTGFVNHGLLSVDSGADLRFIGMSQSATGSLTATNAEVYFTNSSGGSNVLNGSIDLAGADVTIAGTVLIEAGTAVASLGNLSSAGNNTLTGFTGGVLEVDDVFLRTRLNTASNLTDPLRVNGALRSGGGGRMSLPTLVAGTLAPGDPSLGRYGRLQFDRDLTLEAGSSFEVEFTDGPLHDRLRTLRDFTIEAGATLDLQTPSVSAPYAVGTTVVIVDGNNPIEGVFDTVLGLDLGNATQWRLVYDAADLLLTVAHAGDVDGDGFVGAADLDVLLAQWGDGLAAGTGADLSGDGLVGQSDLAIVQANWGAGTPSGPDVPEPGSLALLVGGLWAARRRRRSVGRSL
ncbi:PEP-CTERM sorting domain-containing protein [Phycisphaeraceae bacterium D3-23]